MSRLPTTIIPVHKGKDVDRALLRKILRDTKISPSEFKDILRKS